MTEVEMRPSWWRYAIQAAGMARREIKGMHPDDREYHDIEPDDCSETIKKIRESGATDADKWATVELTDMDGDVILQGLLAIKTVHRDKTPESWKPQTRWAKASEKLPTEYNYVLNSLP